MKTNLINFIKNAFRIKVILFGVFLFAGQYCFAQAEHTDQSITAAVQPYDYYLDITGIDTKEKYNAITELVRNSVKGVTYFDARRYPGKYLTLLANKPISKGEIENVLRNTDAKIVYFATGRRELKLLLLNKVKNN